MAKTQRTIALLLALLFFLTSVATTAYVIWQINREEPVATGNDPITNDQANNTEGPKLQGTQLKDFTPTTTPVTTLEKTDLVAGSGPEAKKSDSITANYTGALVSNGTVFESSLDSGQPFTAKLLTIQEAPDGRGLIAGWVEGIPGMKVGGTRRLVIPAALAYGEAGSPPAIPANADLVFDIELISIGS